MVGSINNVIVIPTSLKKNFFKLWLDFLKPFHKLTDRELEVFASFLRHRYELSKVIKDQKLLEQVTMSEDTKRKVREDCNITQAHFQVIMTKLKKSKVIENNKINIKFVPHISEGDTFQLLLSFSLSDT